ncbi:MAG: RNA polymerase sigma factor [Planctomycetota bacterium]|jgi:RNA polymerase sigma-70 factor (ECF subfamily)
MHENDAEIIQKVLRGEKEAFSLLAEKYSGIAGAVAYSVVGNEENSKDIAQDSIFEAFLKLHKLKNPELFKSWLCKIVRNKAKNWLKKKAREKSAVTAKAEDNSRAESKTAEKDRITEALQKLNEKEREIILLRYNTGLSREETAEILEISQAAADKRLQRGVKKLKEFFKMNNE